MRTFPLNAPVNVAENKKYFNVLMLNVLVLQGKFALDFPN